MKRMAKLDRIILIVLIIFLPIIGSFVFYEELFLDVNYDLKEVERDDYNGIEKLKLKGEVTELIKDVGRPYHGTGIIRINILQSNITSYDPREYQANYICIIKQNKAEFYSGIPYYANVGDKIEIDIPNNSAFLTNSSGKKHNLGLSIYGRDFFDYISINNYQKI
jgi:hypothetical protein